MVLIFGLKNQSNNTPPFHARRMCDDLVEIVYGSVRGQDTRVFLSRQLEDCEEELAEYDKKCMGLELLAAP